MHARCHAKAVRHAARGEGQLLDIRGDRSALAVPRMRGSRAEGARAAWPQTAQAAGQVRSCLMVVVVHAVRVNHLRPRQRLRDEPESERDIGGPDAARMAVKRRVASPQRRPQTCPRRGAAPTCRRSAAGQVREGQCGAYRSEGHTSTPRIWKISLWDTGLQCPWQGCKLSACMKMPARPRRRVAGKGP